MYNHASGSQRGGDRLVLDVLGHLDVKVEPLRHLDGAGHLGQHELTPDQRLRVFVSSTLAELAAERAPVREAIEKLQLTPVLFELVPALIHRATSTAPTSSKARIFVGIYWQR